LDDSVCNGNEMPYYVPAKQILVPVEVCSETPLEQWQNHLLQERLESDCLDAADKESNFGVYLGSGADADERKDAADMVVDSEVDGFAAARAVVVE